MYLSLRLLTACLASFFLCCSYLTAQPPISEQAPAVVPRLVNFSGRATDALGKPIAGVAGVTFAIYKDQSEGAPLWLETQNVHADAKGNYSVQLGSTTPEGLPLDLFSSGDAHWLGVTVNGGQEQPRVLLLSVPYALKAADAETVGGLPPSAFVLATKGAPGVGTSTTNTTAGASPRAPKNAVPANPAVTGTGIAGYIPIWDTASDIVDSKIFQKGSLVGINTTAPAVLLDINGKGDIRDTLTLFPKSTDPTLAVSGTAFKIDQTGKVTFISGQKFPGTGTITGITTATGSGLQGGGTKGTLSLSVDPTVVPKLGLFNTFTNVQEISVTNSFPALQAINLGSGDGIDALGSVAGIFAESSSNTDGAAGVIGIAGGQTRQTLGVFGGTSSPIGIGTEGLGAQSSFESAHYVGSQAIGVWGDTGTGAGYAVFGSADNGFAIVGANNSSSGNATAFFEADENGNPSDLVLETYGGAYGGYCVTDVSGNLFCTGSKSAVVSVDAGSRKVALYAIEGPENWFEDAGSSQLTNGQAVVNLESVFQQTVNTGINYQVFLTPNGDCKGLYVSQKTPTSFVVRELGGGDSSLAFDYRILAKRKGYETIRLADKTEALSPKNIPVRHASQKLPDPQNLHQQMQEHAPTRPVTPVSQSPSATGK